MTLFCSAREFDELCRAVAGKADRIRLQAKGGSMYPFVHSGDWVEVSLRHSGAEDPYAAAKGDILLFKKDGNLYMHRVASGGARPVMRGDLSADPDGEIPAADVIGRVVALERATPGGRCRRIDLASRRAQWVGRRIVDAGAILRGAQWCARAAARCIYAGMAAVQGVRFYRRFARHAVGKTACADIVVREAAPDDAEALRDLLLMGGHDIRRDIAAVREEGFWMVAARREKLVGALTITRHGDPAAGHWVIFGLEVKAHLRGLGIGERIVREAVDKARAAGARHIGLFVRKSSKPALALYRKLGFAESDDHPSSFNRAPGELYMARVYAPEAL